LDLQTDVAPGAVENAADGSGWYSLVDATAGGFGANPPDSYVYARFTSTGLEKVEISDETALDSMDWDVAFRRYMIRINSGNSGPSCVTAATVAGSPPPTYDSITTLPGGLTFGADEFFTASPECAIIEDNSGLPGSPAVALAGYWSYGTCMAMTGEIYVLQLRSGQYLKLTVTQYYWDAQAADPGAGQAACDASGTSPATGSANIHFRWAFLP
jgi:hypothetical protein